MQNRSPVARLIGRKVTIPLGALAALAGLQLLLIGACVLALQQNGLLRERAKTYLKLAAPLVGREVPPISGIDAQGQRTIMTYGGDARPTLIYAFSKNCGACVANWPAMRAVQAMSPQRVRIVYLNTSDSLTPDYLQEHGMGSAVVLSALDSESADHYRVRATPQAELVDAAGRVVWSSLGEFGTDGIQTLITAIEDNTTHERPEGDKP